MKKLLVLTYLSFTFFLLGCSTNKNIELTLDNFDTYLEITARLNGENVYYYSGVFYYSDVRGTVEIESASINYEFLDVVLVVNIYGEYTRRGWKDKKNYDENIVVSLNIGGSGSGYEEINVYEETYTNYAYNITGKGYSVVSISGYAKPLN